MFQSMVDWFHFFYMIVRTQLLTSRWPAKAEGEELGRGEGAPEDSEESESGKGQRPDTRNKDKEILQKHPPPSDRLPSTNHIA